MRLALRDDSGEAVVVVWNEKVEEIEKALRESPRLLLVNARVKETQNGAVEVHVDSNTAITAQASISIMEKFLALQKRSQIKKRKFMLDRLNFSDDSVSYFCARRFAA